MLKDGYCFSKVYIATGYTDLRKGIEGLACMVKMQFDLDPYQKDVLFLFCGKRTNRIKGLLWEGDGFLLMYKRLELGAFSWPRTEAELKQISKEQFKMLMQGFEIVPKNPVREIESPKMAI